MGRLPVLAIAAAAAASVAAAAAPAPRSVSAPAAVRGLAADGTLSALSLAARRGDCRHVRLWDRRSGSLVRLGRPRPCGEVTSTGSGLVGPSLAGQRALWLTYTGGNIREWSLWTATRARRTPVRLRFVARDVEAPAPIVLGEGDSSRFGYLLPYAVDGTVYGLQPDGRTVALLRARARVVGVAAKAGEVAAALETGAVVILNGRGQTLRIESFTAAADAVDITGNALVVQHGRTLAVRTGAAPRSWTLPAGARLVDAEGTLAVYVRGRELHLFSLDTGRDVVLRRTAVAPVATLEPAGLVYAVGAKIAFVPVAALLARMR